MLLNLSKHPSANWTVKQIKASEKYGEILDVRFPQINPNASSGQVKIMSNKYVQLINKLFKDCKDKNNAVHIMGEHNFIFITIYSLLKSSIKCISSTTDRIAEETTGGKKITTFKFVKFREYTL